MIRKFDRNLIILRFFYEIDIDKKVYGKINIYNQYKNYNFGKMLINLEYEEVDVLFQMKVDFKVGLCFCNINKNNVQYCKIFDLFCCC